MKFQSLVLFTLVGSLIHVAHAEGNLERGGVVVVEQSIISAIMLKSSFRKMAIPNGNIAQTNESIKEINQRLKIVQNRLGAGESAELAELRDELVEAKKTLARAEGNVTAYDEKIKLLDGQIADQKAFVDQMNPKLTEIDPYEDEGKYNAIDERIGDANDKMEELHRERAEAKGELDEAKTRIATSKIEIEAISERLTAANQSATATPDGNAASKATLLQEEKDLLERRKGLEASVEQELKKSAQSGRKFSWIRFIGGTLLAVDVGLKGYHLYILEDDNFGYIPLETVYSDLSDMVLDPSQE